MSVNEKRVMCDADRRVPTIYPDIFLSYLDGTAYSFETRAAHQHAPFLTGPPPFSLLPPPSPLPWYTDKSNVVPECSTLKSNT